ncbi:MAG: intermembrane phospholipid transport protein YdbH family protein [Sphingomonas sp.]|uniref:intermembrane phospholipid transport protein YdbH family protein n=1 Tax=Sphingomonas sp. TaxID=28214 RepID=UPI003F7D57E2
MTESEPEIARPSRARRIRVRLGIALALLLVVLGGLWLVRKPVARHFIDDSVAKAHVPARYTIEDLALGHQRLTNIVLGDPAHPDLVADWVEVRTSVGFGGAQVTGLRAGHVRMRAAIVDGKLSLGALDRLLPTTGGALRLPAILLDLEDGRVRLETPQGVVGLKASGSGRLDGGFQGQIAAISERIASGSCVAGKAVAALRVDIRSDAIHLRGPVRAGDAGCGDSGMTRLRADVDAAVATGFDRWSGGATLAADRATAPSLAVEMLGGTVRFAGDARGVQGKARLTADRLASAGIAGQAAVVDGAWRYTGGKGAFTGKAQLGRAALPHAVRARFASIASAGAGTPVAPLAAQLARALDAGARDFALTAELSAATDGGRGAVKVSRLIAVGESGASVKLTSRDGTQLVWPNGGVIVRGDLVTGGGGLPELSARLDQARPGAPVTGLVTMEPYEAGGARLALAPVKFTAGLDGRTRIDSVATLSGPLGGGAVEGLQLPLAAQWDGRGALSVNPGCAPLAVARLRVAGLDARGLRTRLCPVDGAMVRIANGRVGGGAVARDLRLSGALGSSPLALSAAGATVRLGDRRFALDRVAVRLGTPDRLTRLDIATLDGSFGQQIGGHFEDAGGRIGAVPLVLSRAGGTWAMDAGTLRVGGTLLVSDAAHDPRFSQLAGRDVVLTLANNRIAATGKLTTTNGAVTVADVAIAHDLSAGSGSADLDIAGLTFTKAFQPDALTPLTKGVIADVAGTVTGHGHIAWTSQAVTSNGVFRTRGTDLAAAFGVVTGLSGELHFTDLLGMVSAPNQLATVKTIDTGVAVNDGMVHYRMLGPTRIQVADARWPFAGGRLDLDPTLLDFADPGGRRLTFRLTAVDAAQFLQQFDFKNLNATGVFDGALPMIFDASGGRIEKGELHARPGGGSIAYVGELTDKDLGTWGNIAFQALKSLRYRSLDLTLNGPLAGEVITEAHFAGVSQGQGAKSNFIIRRLQRLPFVFNVRIKAPFRSLLDTAQGIYDPSRLIERNLPALIRQQNQAKPPVQPPASETKP